MAKKISRDNLPARLPLLASIVFWLLLDRLAAPGWVWGIIGTLAAMMWLSFIISIFRDKQVDIFADKKDGGDNA